MSMPTMLPQNSFNSKCFTNPSKEALVAISHRL
jgi:hypothetical protein